MPEGLNGGSIDIGTDGLNTEELNTEFEPFDNINIEEVPISGQEIAELLNEAEALDIQPFEDAEALDQFQETAFQETAIDYDAVYEESVGKLSYIPVAFSICSKVVSGSQPNYSILRFPSPFPPP